MDLKTVERIRNNLVNSEWDKVNFLSTTKSTNSDLVTALKNGDFTKQILIANHQIEGKGRLGRSWISPEGKQLIFSFTTEIPTKFLSDHSNRIGWLTLIVGLTVVETLQKIINLKVNLKWPNDVLWKEKKLAGILAELVSVNKISNSYWAVVGVGLNIANSKELADLNTATTLTAVQKTNIDVEKIATHLFQTLAINLAAWKTGTDFHAAYLKHSSTIGREVKVSYISGKTLFGKAIDITSNGELKLLTSQGEVNIRAGEIEHIR